MKQLGLEGRSLHCKLLLLGCLILNSACGQKKQSNNFNSNLQNDLNSISSVNDSFYPTSVISHGLQKEFDERKWKLYLYAVIDTPKNSNGNYIFKNPKSYGAYPILLDTLYSINDINIYFFSFYINGDTITRRKAFDLGIYSVPEAIISSKIGEKPANCIKRRGVTGSDNICFDLISEEDKKRIPKVLTTEQYKELSKGYNRLSFPLNPVVVDYINKHQEDLNPWFVAEAKKRGVIK